jgi:hypothetical protein
MDIRQFSIQSKKLIWIGILFLISTGGIREPNKISPTGLITYE